MDNLRRIVAAAETAKTSAYNANVLAGNLRREVEQLKLENARLVEHIRAMDRRIANLEFAAMPQKEEGE